VTFATTDFGYLVFLEPGDELLRCLIQFARDQEIEAAVVTGLGGVTELELGTGAARDREQRLNTLRESLEICSLTGTLTLVDGEPFPHLHGSFARRDYSVIGGHVYQAVCATTAELAVQVSADAMFANSGRSAGTRSNAYGTAT
jgi:predicted DNA-binding protein with PD1-like motif